jgi:hypothetical protein
MFLMIDADGCYGDEGARVYSAHGTAAEARRAIGGSHRFAVISTEGPSGTEYVGRRIFKGPLAALLASGWRMVA